MFSFANFFFLWLKTRANKFASKVCSSVIIIVLLLQDPCKLELNVKTTDGNECKLSLSTS